MRADAFGTVSTLINSSDRRCSSLLSLKKVLICLMHFNFVLIKEFYSDRIKYRLFVCPFHVYGNTCSLILIKFSTKVLCFNPNTVRKSLCFGLRSRTSSVLCSWYGLVAIASSVYQWSRISFQGRLNLINFHSLKSTRS